MALAAVGPLVLALGVAGCFSDRGVAIEVDVTGIDVGVSSVELYLGTAPCDGKDGTNLACAGIGPPPSMSPVLPGNVWFRDTPLPYTAQVKGHTATFQLQADTPSTVPIVIAVGLMPDGTTGVGTATLTDLEVPAHGARIVSIKLTPASPVMPGQVPPPGEDRVKVWRNATSSCMVVEHGTSGEPDRTFVVPAGDPDCDDIQDPECNPIAWQGARPAGASPVPDCFSSNVVNSTSACVLGSHGCRDTGTPPSGACAPQRDSVCVPSTLCGCDKALAACIQDTLVETSTSTSIKCSVPLRASTLDLCPGTGQISNTIDLNQTHLHYSTSACEQPEIGTLSMTGFGSSATFHGATMKITNLASPCAFGIKWESGNRALDSGSTDYGAIEIPSSNARLLIPIRFDFKLVPACLGTEQFTCTFQDANDSLWACAR